jgi:hypothetical protein
VFSRKMIRSYVLVRRVYTRQAQAGPDVRVQIELLAQRQSLTERNRAPTGVVSGPLRPPLLRRMDSSTLSGRECPPPPSRSHRPRDLPLDVHAQSLKDLLYRARYLRTGAIPRY